MFLTGIRISGYRSFASEIELDHLSKINLLIGQNNSGKSNVLRFLSRHFVTLNKDKGLEIDLIKDKPKKNPGQSISVAVKIMGDDNTLNILGDIPSDPGKGLLKSTVFKDNHIWYYFKEETKNTIKVNDNILMEMGENLAIHEMHWRNLFNTYTHYSGGGKRDWYTGVLGRLNPTKYMSLAVDLIPIHITQVEVSEIGIQVF